MRQTFASTHRHPGVLLALVAGFWFWVLQPVLAHQTTVYKWRDSDGVVSYAQTTPPPDTGGVSSIEVATKTLSPAQRAAARMHLAQIDSTARADARRFSNQLTAGDQVVSRAVQSLAQAEHAARRGRVPRAGERVANAGGWWLVAPAVRVFRPAETVGEWGPASPE